MPLVNSEILVDLENIETLNGTFFSQCSKTVNYGIEGANLNNIMQERSKSFQATYKLNSWYVIHTHTHIQNQTAIIGANLTNKYFTPDVHR